MEENKDYQVYRFDYLTEGSQLKLEHNVYCEDVDISSLITQGADALEALRQDSIDGEQKALAIVQAAAKQWEQQAAVTQKLNRSLEYLRTPEVAHTGNEWRKTGNWRDAEEISNRVYKMTCSVWEDTKYDRETKQSVPVAWYVTWDVYVNSPEGGIWGKDRRAEPETLYRQSRRYEIPGWAQESLLPPVYRNLSADSKRI